MIGTKIDAVARALRAIWIQAGIVLAAILLIEGVLRAYFYATARPQIDWRVSADGYNNAKWVPTYFDELSGFTVNWLPFAYWIGAPYRSRYLNIGTDGTRKGFASSRDRRHAIRIFAFGGSAMWGEGARDDYTIPSWLQRFLDQTAYRTQITNFGQEGYVSTQEMIVLFEQLQKGNIPDVVIFYDGFNDAGSAMGNGVAGSSYDERNRRTEFRVFNQWASDDSLLYEETALALIRHSGMGQLAKRILIAADPGRFKELQGQFVAVDQNARVAPGGERAAVQEDVVRTYLINNRIVDAMGKSFGFGCLFFWQPTVYTKAIPTAYEAKQGWLPGDREFLAGVYERVARAAGQENIHDLSGVFGSSTQPFFIDESHTTEAGNRIIAQAMLPYVLAAIKAKTEEAAPGAPNAPR